ncbi:hypothetical protein K450DRAFT_245632 [Umbelopsis ramanniana AG]|uniref:Exportin-T n=1 Tax=Umbelopsis ramanniana AG TaxID=1314678 RepID=A0AAD5E9H8_UMBRA|nr:uncharacterized protein K450DRAFT_245632 [Umbelopsis ramanniana AG]KAI8578810.1 hypothetical protein K450DRAFT_245632 [Umbelopsis ramanniana AG]
MDQIEQAVLCALSPNVDPALKLQANTYCEQIKDSPDGWQMCLSLFVKEPKAIPQARFFALQVLELTFQTRFDSLDQAAVEYIRQTLMEYVAREYGVSNTSEPEVPFLRNKAAQILTLLFSNVYPTIWPTFFDELIALTETPSKSPTNAKATDFFLRVSLSVDEEIARQDIQRSRDQVNRNTLLKDAMRERDIPKLAAKWFEVLQEYRTRDAGIAELALGVIGSYVAWMDISLVVNDQVMTALYQMLGEEQLRIAACECLAEVVSKGMKPLDKLSLIQMLNITDTLNQLDLSDADFGEHVAKLINVLGCELCQIYAENALPAEAKTAAYALIEKTWPFLLKFLGDEDDDSSCAVLNFVNDTLSLYKKQKKARIPFIQSQWDFLLSLLGVIMMKMKYDEDTEWSDESEEPEDEALFMEMRKNLKVFADSIATINEDLYVGYIRSMVLGTLEKYEAGASLDWREVELCLYTLYLFGESLGKSVMVFVDRQNDRNLTPLGELVSRMVTSGVSSYPHPSVPLQFFENAVRYYQFFEVRPEGIPQVLAAFVDARGLHHPLKQVRSRCWYLFHRYVKGLSPKMNNFVEEVLSSMGDLLVIEAEIPVETNTSDGGKIPAASTFDSQQYLFETVGVLISLESVPDAKQQEYLEIVLNPLVKGIQSSMSAERYNPEDELFTLQLHHYIQAIGAVAKGFPDVPKGGTCNRQWVPVFMQANEIILNVLQALNRFAVIRDAARFASGRLIGCLGGEMLPYLPALINSLLNECLVNELVDFLPFISLIAHKFKPMIFNVLDELLLPLVKRVFDFLNTSPSGTDEALLLSDLRKAYLTFITNLFNYELEGVLVSDTNFPHLNMILQTILHFAKDNSDTSTQKMGFGIFLKMINSWIPSASPEAQNSTTTPVVGFSQYIYESVLPVCFEVPMNVSFNIGDGQALLVFGEISGIQKTMYTKQSVEYVEYIRNVFFPSIQCPPAISEEYCQAIQQLDLRDFKKYFQSFIQKSKG